MQFDMLVCMYILESTSGSHFLIKNYLLCLIDCDIIRVVSKRTLKIDFNKIILKKGNTSK